MTRTTTNQRWTHRLGRGLGRAWRGYQRGERRALGWMVARGTPSGVATALLWGLKLLAFAAVLYLVFWVAVLLACLAAAAWMVRNADYDMKSAEDEEPQWREGHSGYGLYSSDDYLIMTNEDAFP